MTAQEAFDKVVAHFKENPTPCVTGKTGTYKKGEHCCFVGTVLQATRKYRPHFEGQRIDTLFSSGKLNLKFDDLSTAESERLLRDLQEAHDGAALYSFKEHAARRLRNIAELYDLECSL